jgi:hypothetical protein
MSLIEGRLVPFIMKLLIRRMFIHNLHKTLARDEQEQTRLQEANEQ